MYLWTYTENTWAALSLEDHAYIFDREVEHSIRRRRVGEPIVGRVVLRPGPGDSINRHWFLLVPGTQSVRTNGSPVLAGVRRLRDQDELRVRGFRPGLFFFSTESLARIQPLPEGSDRVYCARCRQEIAAESPIVKCPSCGMVHHQSEEFNCWTYADTCAMCNQPTALDSGRLRWTPEIE